MWSFVRENPKAGIFAILVHVVFVAVLVLTLHGKTPAPAVNPDAKIIKAKVIDESKIKKQRQRKEAQKRKKETERRKQQEAQRKKQQEKIKQEKRKAEQQKELALKKKKEAEQKKKLALKKKQEAERKQKLAEEQKRKAEALEKREQQEREQRIADMKKQMELELAREEEERKKAAQKAAQQTEVDRYRALIKQAISNKWRVPFSARKGQECVLRLKLIPSGDVISVEVVKSSGDPEYDLSVEKAVYSAMPLPLPPAESGLFHEFREINVPFRLESRNL